MKKSKLSLVSLIISTIYVIYLVHYIYNISTNTPSNDAATELGTTLGVAIIMPHLTCVGIALLMNVLGYFLNKRSLILTAAILYTVAIALMFIYTPFVIIQTILCYVAFFKMKKPTEITNQAN